MNKRLTNLSSIYQDMRSRYGDDDPMVSELKIAVDRCQTRVRTPAQGLGKDEKHASVLWGRRPREHSQSR